MFPKVTRRQNLAVAALLGGATVTDAARTVGVVRQTLAKWLRQPAFQAALRDGERLALDGAARRLVALSGKAINTLESVLDNADTVAGVKVRCALGILDVLVRLRDLVTVENELKELQAEIEARQKCVCQLH